MLTPHCQQRCTPDVPLRFNRAVFSTLLLLETPPFRPLTSLPALTTPHSPLTAWVRAFGVPPSGVRAANPVSIDQPTPEPR